MLNEDQYLERTPDLVAKVRAMRKVAEKEMNRFTRVADYDLRRVVGHDRVGDGRSGVLVAPDAAAIAGRRVVRDRRVGDRPRAVAVQPALAAEELDPRPGLAR